jgi:EAL domain-containing protein (putative c-di-GMP-specific phosphodiesterase class I)
MVAERVIRSLSEPMRIAGKELYTSASIGIAFSHRATSSRKSCCATPTWPCTAPRPPAGSAFALFDEGLREDALRQLELEGDLRRAVQRNEFEPWYQPIVRLSDGAVVGYEALMRWHNPSAACSSRRVPGTAEETGTLAQIDWQIYDQVCCDIRTLGAHGAYCTINVSPRHLRANGFSERLLALLASHDVKPSLLRLEITEGALLENPDQVQLSLGSCARPACRPCSTTSAPGFSSLSYLHRFPLHWPEDRPQLRGGAAVRRKRRQHRDRARDPPARRFARAGSGRRGHRNRGAAPAVRLLGLTLGQGYLFAQPGSMMEVTQRPGRGRAPA